MSKPELIAGRLIQSIDRTQNIRSFRFAPDKKIDFAAGQFLRVIFDEHNRDNKELNKYLSFSSSPTKDYVEVTKRLSDSKFSGRLRELKPQDKVMFEAPLGSCIFKEEYKAIGFLIGGIGITPVISIIEYVAEKRLDTDILLIYSNRTEDDISFKKELDYFSGINKNVKIIYLVTDCQPKDKRCIFGRIDRELLSENINQLCGRMVFIFGPPKMVETIKELSIASGCEKENIKTESFIGY